MVNTETSLLQVINEVPNLDFIKVYKERTVCRYLFI